MKKFRPEDFRFVHADQSTRPPISYYSMRIINESERNRIIEGDKFLLNISAVINVLSEAQEKEWKENRILTINILKDILQNQLPVYVLDKYKEQNTKTQESQS